MEEVEGACWSRDSQSFGPALWSGCSPESHYTQGSIIVFILSFKDKDYFTDSYTVHNLTGFLPCLGVLVANPDSASLTIWEKKPCFETRINTR